MTAAGRLKLSLALAVILASAGSFAGGERVANWLMASERSRAYDGPTDSASIDRIRREFQTTTAGYLADRDQASAHERVYRRLFHVDPGAAIEPSCDLKQRSSIQVYLHYEGHNEPTANEFKRSIFARAQQGELVALTESDVFLASGASAADRGVVQNGIRGTLRKLAWRARFSIISAASRTNRLNTTF